MPINHDSSRTQKTLFAKKRITYSKFRNYDMEMEIDICMLNEYHEGAISASVCFCIADATTVGFILFYGNKYC